MGNYFLLNEINPYHVFKWYMEFAIDSYEWVMHQNVYDMIYFKSGGKTTKRPYISNSNYLYKMSNYKKDSIWDEYINKLYDTFV